MRPRSMVLLLALFVAHASADGPTSKPAPQPTLKLAIPGGWQDVSKPSDKPGPMSIVLAAREKEGVFSVQIVFLRAQGHPDAFDDDTLKMLLDKAAKPFLDDSDQGAVKPQPLDGNDTHGFFTTLTAKTAKRGDSACVTLANVRLGDGLLAATIRHPDGSPNLPKAIDMIKTATLAAPATKPAAAAPAKPATKPVGKPLGRVRPSPPAK